VSGTLLRPDLVDLRPKGLTLDIRHSGTRRLRFSTFTVNIGAGPMELRSRQLDCDGNGDTTDDRTAVQHTYLDANTDGVFERGTDTASTAHVAGCFAFDAKHGHWHFGDFSTFALLDPGTGEVVAQHRKVGFCLIDDGPTDPNLPGAPSGPFYDSCTLDATQGISIGWTDVYPAWLPSQWINVTDVQPGRYCLAVTVDPSNRLRESNDSNNTAYRLIRIARSKVVDIAPTC
jgi:hypothetical protein